MRCVPFEKPRLVWHAHHPVALSSYRVAVQPAEHMTHEPVCLPRLCDSLTTCGSVRRLLPFALRPSPVRAGVGAVAQALADRAQVTAAAAQRLGLPQPRHSADRSRATVASPPRTRVGEAVVGIKLPRATLIGEVGREEEGGC